MTSEPRRDPVTDPLLTPENSALIVIDYHHPTSGRRSDRSTTTSSRATSWPSHGS
jgi:hypothetical protein